MNLQLSFLNSKIEKLTFYPLLMFNSLFVKKDRLYCLIHQNTMILCPNILHLCNFFNEILHLYVYIYIYIYIYIFYVSDLDA